MPVINVIFAYLLIHISKNTESTVQIFESATYKLYEKEFLPLKQSVFEIY